MEKYILAIDQGTTSTRALIFDKNQKVCKMAQKEIQNSFPHPGWVEQDANEIWLSTLSVLAQIFADGEIKPQQIDSIGITNQRETTILWDGQTGLPVYNAIVWQSRQSNEIVERYRNKGVLPIIKEKTGLVLDPYFSATKINWIFENVEGVKENKHLLFGTVDTWLIWKMTNGRVHVSDVTNASRTLLFNIHTLDWDEELLEIFNVDRKILPEVRDTSGYLGEIDPMHFFNCSCPITACAGDQQAALFGQSCFEKGDVKNTYGTGGFLLMNTGAEPILSEHGLLSTVAWKIKDEKKYALEGSIFVSGSLIQWLRDGLKILPDAKSSEAMAESVADNGGVIIVPAFTGLGAPYWNQKCKGAVFGLTRGADARHLVRASLESMAYQSKDLLSIMEEDANESIRELKVDGGASENGFLLQFQSDILGIPVVKSLMSETTALGAARFAGLASGFWTMEDFVTKEKQVVYPKMDHKEVDRLIEQWKKAVQACLEYE